MRDRLFTVIRSPVFWIFSVLAAIVLVPVGVLKGIQDDIDSDIDSGTEKVLAREVPAGTIDEETGSYRGVALGDPEATVTSKLGKPKRQGRDEVAIPDVLTGSVWAGAGYGSCGDKDARVIAYEEAVFMIANGKVCTITVAGGGWSTKAGLSAGDSVENVRSRYDDAACLKTTNDGPFYEQWECTVHSDSGNRIHFGADPVTTVDLAPPAA